MALTFFMTARAERLHSQYWRCGKLAAFTLCQADVRSPAHLRLDGAGGSPVTRGQPPSRPSLTLMIMRLGLFANLGRFGERTRPAVQGLPCDFLFDSPAAHDPHGRHLHGGDQIPDPAPRRSAVTRQPILYWLNTAGAVSGAGFAGFVLLWHFGLMRTVFLAAGLNLFAARGLWLSSVQLKGRRMVAPAQKQRHQPAPGTRRGAFDPGGPAGHRPQCHDV